MTTFDSREQAFENKFAHDEELHFRVMNRRNKLLGQWAASRLGLAGDAAQSYAQEVVMSDFAAPGDEDVLQKVLADFIGAEIETSPEELRTKMESLIPQAHDEVMAE